MADPGATLEGLPPVQTEASPDAEQAPHQDDGVEQPTAGTETDNVLDLLRVQAKAAPDPSTPEFWETEVDVRVGERTERMSLDDMRKGAMRQADYTRKTQELARERGLVSEAVEFHRAFKDDPQGFARYLASKAGLISEDGAETLKGVTVYTDAEIEAQVAARLETALAEHPDVTAARDQQGVQLVARVLDGIEQKWQMPLSTENRRLVLEEAQRRGTTDLELVFESLLLRANQIAQARQSAQRSAPTRPGAGAPLESNTAPKIVTVQDAWEAAERELSGTVA